MDYNENEIKIIINKYINFVDNLKYNYDDRIKNLLYLIVPAFIIRYKLDHEKLILNTFLNVPIIIDDNENNNVPAYYINIPKKIGNEIKIHKAIVIQNFKKNSLIGLLDSLVHEYNHAINSYNNPFIIKDDKLYVRTGLSNFIYNNSNLEFIEKEKSYILEEVLNTFQTEQIINIIHSFKKYNFNYPKINTSLYILDNHINKSFDSNAYYLEKFFSNDLLYNKTFTSTLSNLRITGFIEDIEYWFDNITGIKDSYKVLINNMIEINHLKHKQTKWKWKENKIKRKIVSIYKEEKKLIETFNRNCN